MFFMFKSSELNMEKKWHNKVELYVKAHLDLDRRTH